MGEENLALYGAKNDLLAAKLRQTGNEEFKEENYLNALESFTASLAFAETQSLMSMAYGNRSACFFRLGMPKECLEEITRALDNNFPANIAHKLVARRRRAEKLTQAIKRYYDSVPEIPQSQRNPSIECASNCVKIEEGQLGKHIIATRDIKIGEVIAVERPYASVALDPFTKSYCHHCLELCYNLIPCRNCAAALFCSGKCLQKADSYHKFECLVIRKICMRFDVKPVAFRIAVLAVTECFNVDKIYRSDRYKEVSLLKPRKNPSAFEEIVVNDIIDFLCSKTDFFSRFSSHGFDEEQVKKKFKEVMCLQMVAIDNTAVKIYEYDCNFTSVETVDIAYGLYSFFSLFNHSCCANVMKSFHGNTMVLRALNTIKTGEQCFVNRYGVRYEAYPKTVREEMLLSNLLPPCKCTACTDGWKASLGDIPSICRSLGTEKMDFGDIVRIIIGHDTDVAGSLLPKLTSLLKTCERSEPAGNALTLKRLIAHCYVIFGNRREL